MSNINLEQDRYITWIEKRLTWFRKHYNGNGMKYGLFTEEEKNKGKKLDIDKCKYGKF